MEAQIGPASKRAADGHVDDTSIRRPDPPVRSRSMMAQDGARPSSKHGSHPPAFPRELVVSHRVHAAVNQMQATTSQPQLDRATMHAQVDQLRAGYHSMLVAGKCSDMAIRQTFVRLAITVMHKDTTVGHGADDGARTFARG